MIAPSVPPHRVAPPPSLVGQSLDQGRYVVIDELGAGGMGEVYRARDTRLNRDVAIKRIAPGLRDDPDARARFLREVRRTSRLDDPHLAVVHDVLAEDGDVFLVLELVHGRTLRERLTDGPLPLDEFLSLAIQSARALAAAHAHGIVHCDLKPENVMCMPNGHIKVLDFGLARALPRRNGPEDPTREPSSMSATSPAGENAGVGTAPYMSPEALRGEPCDEKSDLFALGIVLYEAWAGRHPFRGPNAFVTSDHILHDAAAPASTVREETPPGLDEALAHLLQKSPLARPASATAVLGALQTIAHGRPGVVDPPPRRRLLVAPAVLARAGLIALLAIASTGAVLGLNPPVRHALARTLGIEKPLPARRLVAVLPFSVTGGDASTQALADGLAYTLASQLTRAQPYASPLQVASMGEIQREAVRTASDARKKLGATLAVEGSVQQLDSGLRVTCAIVDPIRRVQLRSATIDDNASSGGLLQDRVALAVAEMLELGPRAQDRVASRAPRSPGGRAEALFLEGRGLLPDYHDPARIARARELFRGAIALDSTFAPAWAGLGEAEWAIFSDGKDPAHANRAREACERAVRLAPDLPDGHIGLGQVEAGTGFPEIAIREFQNAIALDATSDAAYRGLASAYQALGREDEAENAFREAISRHPDYWGGYSWLGVFYVGAARYPEAVAMFRRVTELAPDNSRGWRNLGVALGFLGRKQESMAALEHAIALRPDYQAYNNLAAQQYYGGQVREAVANYRRALVLNDKDYRVWGNLADCYRHLPGGNPEASRLYLEAIARAESALETNPRDATAMACLAEYHAHLGHRTEATRRLASALSIRPEDPELNFYGVIVCEELGDRAGALAYLRRSVEQGYSLDELEHNPDLAAFRSDPDVKLALAKRG